MQVQEGVSMVEGLLVASTVVAQEGRAVWVKGGQ